MLGPESLPPSPLDLDTQWPVSIEPIGQTLPLQTLRRRGGGSTDSL